MFVRKNQIVFSCWDMFLLLGSRWSCEAIQQLCLLLAVRHHGRSVVLPLQTAWLYFPGTCIRRQKCTRRAKFQREVISFMLVNLKISQRRAVWKSSTEFEFQRSESWCQVCHGAVLCMVFFPALCEDTATAVFRGCLVRTTVRYSVKVRTLAGLMSSQSSQLSLLSSSRAAQLPAPFFTLLHCLGPRHHSVPTLCQNEPLFFQMKPGIRISQDPWSLSSYLIHNPAVPTLFFCITVAVPEYLPAFTGNPKLRGP